MHSGMEVFISCMSALRSQESEQVLAIGVVLERCPEFLQLSIVDPSVAPGNFLGTRDRQTLSRLDRLDKVARLKQRLEGPGIKPGGSTTEQFDIEFALLEINVVDAGDFQFTSCGWFDRFRNFNDLIIVENTNLSRHSWTWDCLAFPRCSAPSSTRRNSMTPYLSGSLTR